MNSKPDRQDWISGLVEQHQQALCRYAYQITGDTERAQDAVQETFLRLCREKREKVEEHVVPWLFRVCRSRALDIVRKEKPVKTLDFASRKEPVEPAGSPAEAADVQDMTGHIFRQLATLPQRQQEIVRLKFQQQLSYREIAEVVGISVGNVGFILHTAMQTLRTRLEEISS
jgi:RNA polymerase sigma-70 factor (ECF subfamily)